MSMPPSGGPQDPNSSGGQWGQQPPQQPQVWGQQPPAGFGGPPPQQWAPQPKKSKTGLIIASVVALLLLAGGGAAAVIALTGDDDDKSDDRPSVVADGYSHTIPEDWIDATDELAGQGAPSSIETVIAWGDQLDNSRANMIVESQSAGGATDPEEMRTTWEATMTQAAGGTAPDSAPGITVDGQESIGVRLQRENASGVEIVQEAYLMISGDTAYAITLSYQPRDESDVQSTFDEIIDSWEFTD